MSINWDLEIKDFEDKTMFIEDGVPLTLARAAIAALTAQGIEDQNSSGEDRFMLGKVANRVFNREDLSIEDLAKVKIRIGKFFSPTVVYRAWLILDPTNASK
jgi:hypothetical protein